MEGVDYVHVTRDRDGQWGSNEHVNEYSGPIKYENFLTPKRFLVH